MKTIILDTTFDFKALVGDQDTVFYVYWQKKTNGQFSSANGKLNVWRDGNGKPATNGKTRDTDKETANAMGLVHFWNVDKNAMRSFYIEDLIILRVNGQEYRFGK